MQCPRCHQQNRQGRRPCSECGASLALACLSRGFSNGQPLGSSQSPTAQSTSPESYTPKHLAEKILTSTSALEGERKQVTSGRIHSSILSPWGRV